MLTLEEILSELEEKTKFSRKQLYEKVKKKHEELSGLVSMEGAGHLIARDIGVSILKPEKRALKIKNMVNGMNNVGFKARIIQITDIRTFKRKDGSQGKVCNLLLTDGTGEIRIPLWDKQSEKIENGDFGEGDIIEVKNASINENTFGGIEARLSKISRIKKLENDKSLPTQPVGEISRKIFIKDAKEGIHEIKGSIVHVFNANPFFQTCPECRKTLEKIEDKYKCPEHGDIKNPENNMIISGIIDDGTGSMRTVFFRDQAKEISREDSSMLLNMSQDEAIDLIKENVLGNEFVLKGRIKKNKIFDTLELIVNEVEEIDVEKETKKLISEIESFK